MESILVKNSLYPFRSIAASIGGRNDMGRLLSPSGRKIITDNIAFHNIPLIKNSEISGLDNLALTIDDGITRAELIALQTNYTTGVITATIEESTMAELLAKTDGVNNIASGDAFSVVLTQTAIDAEDLVELNGMTSGLITVEADDSGAGASTITGSLADVKAIMEAKVASGNGILNTSVADAIVELDDTGAVDAADLNIVLAATSADVDLNAGVTTITGLIADVNLNLFQYADTASEALEIINSSNKLGTKS